MSFLVFVASLQLVLTLCVSLHREILTQHDAGRREKSGSLKMGRRGGGRKARRGAAVVALLCRAPVQGDTNYGSGQGTVGTAVASCAWQKTALLF